MMAELSVNDKCNFWSPGQLQTTVTLKKKLHKSNIRCTVIFVVVDVFFFIVAGYESEKRLKDV